MSSEPTPPATPPAPPSPPRRESTTAVIAGVLVLAAVGVAVTLVGRGQQGATSADRDRKLDGLVARSRELAGGKAPPAEVLAPLLEAYQLDPDDQEVNAELGKALYRQQRGQEALPHLERAAARGQADHELQLALGVCLTAAQRYPDARAALERAATIAPAGDGKALCTLAMVTRLSGDPKAAIELVERSLEAQPGLPMALGLLASLLDEVGRPDDAIAPLRSLSLMNPFDVQLRNDIDDRLIDRDGWAAVASSTKATAEAPGASTVDCYAAGRLLSRDPRRVAEARALLERSLALDATNPWARLALGIEDLRDGDVDGARRRLETLAQEVPPFAHQVQPYLVRLHRLRCDPAAVASHLAALPGGGQGASQEPLIAAKALSGDLDGAEQLARAVVAPDAPRGAPARYLLAQVLVWRGQFDAAGEILAAIREGAPPVERAAWWGLEALNELDAGREDSARKAFDAALADVPQGRRPPPQLLLWSGVTRALSDPEAARRLWERGATTGLLQNPEAFHTWCCRRLIGQATRAEVLAAARFEGFDRNDALFVEGLACELQGDLEAAREAYTAARDATFGPEHPRRPIERALERLARR